MKRALLVLLVSVVLVACDDGAKKVQISASRKDAQTVQKAAVSYYQSNGKVCPQVGELTLPRDFQARGAKDAWGGLFKVTCNGEDVVVSSAGPDKKEGTHDDITTSAQ